ncbi:glycosyltransferase family 4 protein [Candidatus Zixiibacteriota bacterium]
MRLLHVIEDLGVGGIERLLEDILPRLRDAGHEVEVLCLWEGGTIAERLQENGIQVHIAGVRSYWHPGHVTRISRYIRKLHVDLVHAHGSFANIFMGFASRLPGFPPLVIQHHTLWTGGVVRRQVFAEKHAGRRAARVLCVSQATADSLTTTGIMQGEKTQVICNGIDIDRFPVLPASDRRRLISVGSLAPHKGHMVLLLAMEILLQRYPDALLTLVGDGPERARIEGRIEASGLQNHIRLEGIVDNVGILLGRAGLFVFPSIAREGLGIALLEAMSTGLPVIASDCGGIREVVEHEVTGLLVPPGNPEALADAIGRLIKDGEEAHRLAAAGRRRIEERFTVEQTCRELVVVYHEVQRG